MKGGTRKRGKTWSYYFDAGTVAGKRNKIERGGFRTKKDAEKALNEALSDFNKSGRAFTPSNMVLSDYLDLWLKEYAKINVRAQTYRNYSYFIDDIKRAKIGSMRLSDIRPSTVQAYVNSINHQSKNTIKSKYGVLRAALKYAVYPMEYIATSPCQNIKLPNGSGEAERHTFIPIEEFSELMEKLEHHHQVPCTISYYTGMRLSEVLGLTWDRVDLKQKTITIDRQLMALGKEMSFGKPKTKTSIRVIPINDSLVEYLRSECEAQMRRITSLDRNFYRYYEQEDHSIIKSVKTENRGSECDFVCTEDNGRLIIPSNMRKPLRALGYTFHSFRHSHATMLIDAGVSPKTVQLRLGHATIQITYDRYVHETDEMRLEAVKVMEQFQRWQIGGKQNKKP